ncbi:DUF2125 domain-containing protein [Litoreibacter roseus]|uniref:DUF2125 domain-containing protein n=1 Tax=Litoreibacter roseus TaxID=2601869 RepID=A0A6N6JGB1_9RHOB|nr:DUF2125 domain-containing protein [Litoreibacter roseus]GFE65266.1 hypothetical protein KIN_23400 [Litoreibacter roseus]
MKKLLVAVLVGAALWSGYWFIGAQKTKSELNNWLAARADEGWQVEVSDFDLAGYPNRFDTTFEDVQLTDPETGWSWSAPFFQLMSLSYQPNHIIAVWPNTQTFATPERRIDIASQKMNASMVVAPSETLDLRRATLIMDDATFASTDGWTTGFRTLNAAIRETEGTPLSYDIAVTADQVQPGEPLRKLLDQGGTLPGIIEGLTVDVVAGFSEPLSKLTIEEARPDITSLTLNKVEGSWGELNIRLAGDLEVSSDGTPTGDIKLNARNWREMIRMAVESGALNESLASSVELGLGLFSGTSGGENSIDVTVSFRSGGMYIGPIPFGDAPKLVLR